MRPIRLAVILTAALSLPVLAQATPISVTINTTPSTADVGSGFFRLNDMASLSGGVNPTVAILADT